MTTLTNLLTAGDTLDFTTSVPDYPASEGWTLKYRLAPRAAGTAYDITATPSGDDYLVQASAATTANYAPGDYTWTAWVEKAGEVYTVDRGQLEIRARSSTLAPGHDGRSHARKVLDAIEAVIEGRATKDQEEYQIRDRSLKRTPMAVLLKLRALYLNEVRREDDAANLAAGGRPRNRILVRFGRPS